MDKENYIASVLMGNANVDDLPIALVLFLAVEIKKLSQEGQITEEQKVSFQKYIKNFEKEFASNTSAKNAESAFWLGVNYGAITGKPAHNNDAMLENIEQEKAWQMRGLNRTNSQKKDTKDLIQLIAKMLWINDKSKSIRLGEMCEIVWDIFITQIDSNKTISNEDKEYFKKELPNMPSSLKSWLRKGAPEYAKKGGRPKGK